MSTRLIELVENLPRSRVVLVGDFMLDRYLYGNAERLSPEAPVPVLHFQHDETRLGGAGGVAADLAALGAEVRCIGIVGADDVGKQVRRLLSECGAEPSGVIDVANRPTSSKVRLVGLAQHRHPQQLMRLDYEEVKGIDAETARRVEQAFVAAIDGAAVVCIEDYNKGLLTDSLCKRLIEIARSKKIPVIVDPANIADYSKYTGATAIKLNRTETQKVTGQVVKEEPQIRAAAEALLDRLKLEAAVITLDKSGAYLATRESTRQWLKTRPRHVYDVTGAGDMVLAMLSVARAGGASWSEAVALANVAGGLEVEKFGSVPVNPQEIIQELLSEVHEHLGKERTLERLIPELAAHRATGKKIVFTNGCFDLIHVGHVKYFKFAKEQGDLLVVGVNTDHSIRGLKGSGRPIIVEEDRVKVLEELESIDYLVRFDDQTPMRLIDAIRPDVLVKGADYKKEQVVGWDLVESYGGRVALAPLIDGKSTSAIVQKILDAHKDR